MRMLWKLDGSQSSKGTAAQHSLPLSSPSGLDTQTRPSDQSVRIRCREEWSDGVSSRLNKAMGLHHVFCYATESKLNRA